MPIQWYPRTLVVGSHIPAMGAATFVRKPTSTIDSPATSINRKKQATVVIVGDIAGVTELLAPPARQQYHNHSIHIGETCLRRLKPSDDAQHINVSVVRSRASMQANSKTNYLVATALCVEARTAPQRKTDPGSFPARGGAAPAASAQTSLKALYGASDINKCPHDILVSRLLASE